MRIKHPDSGIRHWGDPIELSSECIITMGITSSVSFGLFGICDGHGGVEDAKFASKCIPLTLATVLSESFNEEKLLSQDAFQVLCETFFRTEECMTHYYEGCTATVLLIWRNGKGDCLLNVQMSLSVKLIALCLYAGLNLARMLGDKFLKHQDIRFSSKPYISQVVHIDRASRDFAIIASNGFWDVIGMKKSAQLALQSMERYPGVQNLAEKIANSLLSEARNLRTKDDTSIIFLDFSSGCLGISSFKANGLVVLWHMVYTLLMFLLSGKGMAKARRVHKKRGIFVQFRQMLGLSPFPPPPGLNFSRGGKIQFIGGGNTYRNTYNTNELEFGGVVMTSTLAFLK